MFEITVDLTSRIAMVLFSVIIYFRTEFVR